MYQLSSLKFVLKEANQFYLHGLDTTSCCISINAILNGLLFSVGELVSCNNVDFFCCPGILTWDILFHPYTPVYLLTDLQNVRNKIVLSHEKKRKLSFLIFM
jgi:hypothetical protein